MQNLFIEIHALVSQSIQQIDVIHCKMYHNFSKCMATELQKVQSWKPKEFLS